VALPYSSAAPFQNTLTYGFTYTKTADNITVSKFLNIYMIRQKMGQKRIPEFNKFLISPGI
jgi:hypothetical protein